MGKQEIQETIEEMRGILVAKKATNMEAVAIAAKLLEDVKETIEDGKLKYVEEGMFL